MSNDKIKETARIYALQNAIQFNGRANSKAVIGKVIAVLQKQGFSPKEIIPVVNKTVAEINKIPIDKQRSELEKKAPELLVKEKKERDFSLPELPNAKQGKVVTRFPPEPNGYLHIGHAKASIVDYEYAKMYNGKFILRFDDTNPDNVQPEFYDVQKEDLRWLGIEWDKEYHTSDNLEKHYELAEQLIKQKNAYLCNCPPDDIKKGRFHGHECDCRCDDSCTDDIDVWKEIISSSVDGYILRLRGDMTCDNTAMRDPTLFRVIDKPHPLHGSKYRMWPTYDFAGPVEDSLSGVTHPFRTKEYELRDECYYQLLGLLNLRKPYLMEFARLSITGMPVSKRKIKPLIEQGLVSGYDDIRLPTLRGLKKRGILPQAIKNFIFSQGISKSESNVAFSLLEAENRKIVDPIAKRYFFVNKPVKLVVENAPKIEKSIVFHPTNKLGSRKIKTKGAFYIQKSDIEKLKTGDIFRLKDLYNVKIKKIDKESVLGEYAGEKLISKSQKIQWTADKYVIMNIFVPDIPFKKDKFNSNSLEKIDGFAEESVSKIKNDEIVQFERFGFVKIENKNGKITGYFAHK